MASTIRGSDNFDSAGGNACKAWVNFNGTGTVAIRASYNVSSITDNGTGDYTVNFTSALADGNYALSGTSSPTAAGGDVLGNEWGATAPTASACRVGVRNRSTGVLTDETYVTAVIHR
jgi:hypothetical protein